MGKFRAGGITPPLPPGQPLTTVDRGHRRLVTVEYFSPTLITPVSSVRVVGICSDAAEPTRRKWEHVPRISGDLPNAE